MKPESRKTRTDDHIRRGEVASSIANSLGNEANNVVYEQRRYLVESHEFDQLARSSAGAPTRRTVVRGLVAVLGSVGLGLGVGAAVDAKGKKKNKHKKKQCNTKGKICATPLNPCATAECKKGKCVSGTKQDGTVCGDGLVCQAGACVCPNGVCTVKVKAAQQSNWFGYDDTTDEVKTSILNFITGPGNPPYGPGSVQIASPANQRYNLATYQFSGIRLADITTLKFTSYSPSAGNSGGPNNTAYLHFNVDFFGSDKFQNRLVYVPSANGTVTRNTWTEWDAIEGGNAEWTWSKNGSNWPNDTMPNTTPKTWSEILADYPNARIKLTDSFLGVRIGTETLLAYTDDINAVTLGTAAGTTRFVFGPS
jgi:hypothetical protein